MEQTTGWLETAKRIAGRIKESLPGRFIQKYYKDNAPLYATVIAYNAILSMFPIILVLLAIAGIFVRDAEAMQAVTEAIVRILPSDVEADALRVVQASRIGTGLFGLVGVLGLLWSGSALFGAMADGFNRAFGVPGRGFLEQKLMAFGMILVFASLMLLSLIASSLAGLFLSFSFAAISVVLPGISWIDTVTAWVVSLVLGFLLFLSVYWIVPNRSFTFREVWPGAAVSAVLYFLIVQAWPIYIAYFGRFNRFGAVFGLFFLIMTWFYFLAQIVMTGAELNAFLLERRTTQ